MVESAAAQCVVPLLSREGLTRRLLAGAAAPWSPALDPEFVCFGRLNFPARQVLVCLYFRPRVTAALTAPESGLTGSFVGRQFL